MTSRCSHSPSLTRGSPSPCGSDERNRNSTAIQMFPTLSKKKLTKFKAFGITQTNKEQTKLTKSIEETKQTANLTPAEKAEKRLKFLERKYCGPPESRD